MIAAMRKMIITNRTIVIALSEPSDSLVSKSILKINQYSKIVLKFKRTK